MDGMMLLNEARAAGLTVEAEGDRLRIRGPKRAESVALKLLAHKPTVLGALRFQVPDGWSRESWVSRLRFLAAICVEPIRARELSEWADGLDPGRTIPPDDPGIRPWVEPVRGPDGLSMVERAERFGFDRECES